MTSRAKTVAMATPDLHRRSLLLGAGLTTVDKHLEAFVVAYGMWVYALLFLIVFVETGVVVMPFLSWAQRRTGRELHSGSVVADSTQTLLCTYLSAVLLVGLLINQFLGWTWADPVAGLVIAAVAAREGVEAWRGENCGCGSAC